MKYKPLTENQIVISIDRLTRFKPTEDKYLRVFKDIIISNLIEPKIKKSELNNMSYQEITDIATEIFNNSLSEKNNNFEINEILKNYENSIFKCNNEVNELLNNRINFLDAISLIKDNDNLPINLRWLKNIQNGKNLENLREEKKLLFPIKTVVIVEGITEEILLPKFAQILNYDFDKYGIKIIPAGGKNQVVKLYYSLCEKLNIPMFILLDKDAEENVLSINKKLRSIDKVHLLDCGEFEDLLPKSLIIRTINSHFKNFVSISLEELSGTESMVETLKDFFKEKGTHEFKKAEFAHLIHEQIISKEDISNEIKIIISKLSILEKPLKSLI